LNTDNGNESGRDVTDVTSVMLIGGLPILVVVLAVIVVVFIVTKTLLKRHRHNAGNHLSICLSIYS